MILAIKELLSSLVECAGEPLGVIRIETTNPVYLVFSGLRNQQPRWVVRFASESRVARSEEVLRVLHSAAPDLVPSPIGSRRFNDRDWMQVQSGMGGHPWFRIRQRVTTPTQWEQVREAARTALVRLHDAIRSNEQWTNEVDIAAELRKSWGEAKSWGFNSPRVDVAIERELTMCAGRRVRWFAQHGDFCINNLLIEDERARVVDFDEFALTAMPLHDEFSLALSLHEMTPEAIDQALSEQVTFVLEQPHIAESGLLDLVGPLWLHHLLWRIVNSYHIPNRREQVERWVAVLERSVNDDYRVGFA